MSSAQRWDAYIEGEPKPVAIRQRTPEWTEARRAAVTSTDIAVILGLSPWKSEGALAREKLGTPDVETIDAKRERVMRLGLALESVVRDEDEREHGIKLRRVNRLLTHPKLSWAMTSLDFERVGERTIVEAKTSRSGKWDDGLPQDVEAQVRWQMGVASYPRAHVALLRSGSDLMCFDVEHDPDTFDALVVIAEDFRRRLADGGPFAENAESIKARYPVDNGTVLPATPDLVELVELYRSAKATKQAAEDAEKTAGNALRAILRDASGVEGLVTYRKSADSTRTNWPAVASAYRQLITGHAEDELDALVSIHSETAQGPRVLRLLKEKASD